MADSAEQLPAREAMDFDVVVVGAGPAGLATAIRLKQQALLKKLGKYKTGKGCLYINQLADVDMAVLKEIIKKGAEK